MSRRLLARQVLDRNLPPAEVGPDSAAQMVAIESFIAGMTDWVSIHVSPGHFADDDRESIYRGRGE